MNGNMQKMLAQVVGVVLTLVGIVGFFTGGVVLIFSVNALHNVVHLVSGLAGLYAGFMDGGKRAMMYNQLFGVIYLVVAVLGFLVPSLLKNLLAMNAADNVLHLVLGIVLAGVGFGMRRQAAAA